MAGGIYYLPGRGGRLHTGLGEGLLSRGFGIVGRETIGEFARIGFTDQVATIAGDLKGKFWHDDARAIANSFGAYLFLHAQATLPPFPGKVLLLSPIVGGVKAPGQSIGFLPPQTDRLMQLARASIMPAPRNCEIHVGTEDWVCSPGSVAQLADLLGAKLHLVQGASHMLGKEYVGSVLDSWLNQKG